MYAAPVGAVGPCAMDKHDVRSRIHVAGPFLVACYDHLAERGRSRGIRHVTAHGVGTPPSRPGGSRRARRGISPISRTAGGYPWRRTAGALAGPRSLFPASRTTRSRALQSAPAGLPLTPTPLSGP